jgi:hypothetical protein
VGIDTALFSGKAGSRAAESQKFGDHGRRKTRVRNREWTGKRVRERKRRESCSPPTIAILGNAMLISILQKLEKEIKVSGRTSLPCLKGEKKGFKGLIS